MLSDRLKMAGAMGFGLSAALAACAPSEDAGDCSDGSPCPNRGQICDVLTNTCQLAELDDDATGPTPAPQEFTRTLPFFRGTVCMPTAVKPGDTIPVHLKMCVHTCVTKNSGYKFKKQYKCVGSSCDAAVVAYVTDAAGAACPEDVWGRFDESQCAWVEIPASAGPLNITSGPISGNAKIEVPFLSNEDAAEIAGGASTDKIWSLIYQYPQDAERVFSVSMQASNPSAPADCKDGTAGCTCKEIGF